MSKKLKSAAAELGFITDSAGIHTSRTMMFNEISSLIAESNPDCPLEEYKALVLDQNVLDKPTHSSRKKTLGYLVRLYGLCPSIPLFRVFRSLAENSASSIPQLALTLAYCRDSLLKESAQFILPLAVGAEVHREDVETLIEENHPGRFSPAMKKSLAQNLNGTWTFSGHLKGRSRKTRIRLKPTPESACYAMLAGYLSGLRGEILLGSEFGSLVSVTKLDLTAALRKAASRDLCDFKHAAGVTKFDFPQLLTPEEIEKSHV